jgi:hypothetical protein
MSDTDELAAIGLRLTAALTSAYSSADPNAALVFLPGGITVPGDIVQAGSVNAAQMGTFLETNFDTPFTMSPSESAVHGRDSTYGTSSEIYVIAATSAQPVGSPSDATWKRIAAEIAGAQRNLPGPGMEAGLVCEPDDWILPANTDYWTTFDSTQSQVAPAGGAPTTSSQPQPAVNPHLWIMRSTAMVPMHLTAAVVAPATQPAPAAQPAARIIAMRSPAISAAALKFRPIDIPQTQPPANQEPPPPPPSASISVRLEHQCVTLGYLSGGSPWWSAAFLADVNWYIPGMARGGLLPAPQPTADRADLAYGRPVAMIVVKDLEISGNWTNEGAGSVGSIGPFSLVGATTTPGTNGVMTFARHGMQVIALLCSRLPVLPPVDAPPATSATSGGSSTATSQPTAGTPVSGSSSGSAGGSPGQPAAPSSAH